MFNLKVEAKHELDKTAAGIIGGRDVLISGCVSAKSVRSQAAERVDVVGC
jgi:hypothetical protein